MDRLAAGYQLSPQQRHLWSLQEGGKARPAQLTLLLQGPLDPAKLRNAVDCAVRRHEILRTTFQRQPGMKFPFQVVHDESTAAGWEEVDLGSLEASEQDTHIGEILKSRTSISLHQLPTVRAVLVKLSEVRHVLILSMPAMCMDSGSLNQLALEIGQFYGSPVESLAKPIQYADYSEWLNELHRNEDEQWRAARSYWRAQEFLSSPGLDLPLQRRPADPAEFQPVSIPISVHPLIEKALDAAANHDIAHLLLACWACLLRRLTGRTDLVIGYTIDGRNLEGLDKSLGPFTTRVALRCRVEEGDSVPRSAQSIRISAAEAGQWADYFEYGSSAPNPPVGFVREEMQEDWKAGDIGFSIASQLCHVHSFRLQLRCSTGIAGWRAILDYDPQFFGREVAEGMVRHFEILLNDVAARPLSACDSLEIMDKAERRQVLAGFNQTATDYPGQKCVQHLFEEQAARTPNRFALRFGEQEFSYTDLNGRANQLAHFLRRQGVKGNVAVGLCVERSAEMILGLLGILKAGGCYVPLVPDNPKPRLAHQLAETAAPILITEERLLPQLPDFAGPIVCLDRDRALLATEDKTDPEHNNTLDDLAYVIYTSGSTGVPKGVAVRHRNLVNYANFICQKLESASADVGLHFATVSTLSADLGNTSIFPSLISGGCLHVISYEVAMAGNLFADYTRQHPVDVLKITPSHLAILLGVAEGKECLPRRYLVMGGEVLSWALAEQVMQSSDCELINHYGPTEATIGCCTFDARRSDVRAWNPATVPIGRPIANARIYILDQHQQPVPVGAAGELYVGGAGLAQGYLNQPQQTAERFVADPFSSDPEARLYRTGDLGRFLPDGNIEFLGRIDHQVKIRGFRVEPAEIEVVLKKHPAVKQVFVAPYEEHAGDRRLAAYVVSEPVVKADELRTFVSKQLPEYMLPTIVLLETLPLNANGKVDLRALPSPVQDNREEQPFIEPSSEMERTLASIWSEVLGVQRVGVDQNFFDLGGHSLLATQIIARIRNRFRVQLPLHGFLETPTVAGLAEKIAQSPVQQTEEEELAELLSEIEGLSDAEAQRVRTAELDQAYKPGGTSQER